MLCLLCVTPSCLSASVLTCMWCIANSDDMYCYSARMRTCGTPIAVFIVCTPSGTVSLSTYLHVVHRHFRLHVLMVLWVLPGGEPAGCTAAGAGCPVPAARVAAIGAQVRLSHGPRRAALQRLRPEGPRHARLQVLIYLFSDGRDYFRRC